MQVSLGGVCISCEHRGPFLTPNNAWRVFFRKKKTLNLSYSLKIFEKIWYIFPNTWWSVISWNQEYSCLTRQHFKLARVWELKQRCPKWASGWKLSWNLRKQRITKIALENLKLCERTLSPHIYTSCCISWFHSSWLKPHILFKDLKMKCRTIVGGIIYP